MSKDFEDLPFWTRPDLTPYLIHLTKNTIEQDGFTAFDNLVEILKNGKLHASNHTGFIKGPNKATCFMDVPFNALKYVLDEKNANPINPKYEPYGIFFTKKFAYKKSIRPVLYLSNSETKNLGIPKSELWRIVRFEVKNNEWISFLHEREWRCKGDFKLPNNPGVLVKTTREYTELTELLKNQHEDFKVIPRTIIPLDIMCQGLFV